ncbi:hypothetical protein RB195_015344 [Necator americanus]|uniref:Uncharacterized protein n=1 Tax=Necator americanus TaxID=51031 RepID=A0ABR1E4D7_NECAM
MSGAWPAFTEDTPVLGEQHAQPSTSPRPVLSGTSSMSDPFRSDQKTPQQSDVITFPSSSRHQNLILKRVVVDLTPPQSTAAKLRRQKEVRRGGTEMDLWIVLQINEK